MFTSQRRIITVALSTLAAVAILGGCAKQAPPPPPPAMGAVTVVTLKPESVTLTRELPGRVNPQRVAEVRPQVSGIVKERLFAEGGVVKAGQALYQLDDATYRADVASAKAALARAQAALQAARLAARRADELAKIEAVSKQEQERATAALRQAEADVAVAKAALDRSAVVLGYSRITAPIGGRIGKSTVTQGALVTANQAAALATVQQIDPVYVDLTQTSSELLQLRKQFSAAGDSSAASLPVALLLEDGSRYAHSGKLAFSDISVDPTTGSFSLRLTVPNPGQVLLPGMYVRAIVGEAVRNDAILAPQQGIARDAKGHASALLVNKEGKVELREVKLSRTVGNKWLVEEGLATGDKVIVEGLQKIKPGMPVQATEAGADGAPQKAEGAAGMAGAASPAPAAAAAK